MRIHGSRLAKHDHTQSFRTISQVFPVCSRPARNPRPCSRSSAADRGNPGQYGEIDFGGRVTAKATLAIWPTARLRPNWSANIPTRSNRRTGRLRGKPKICRRLSSKELRSKARLAPFSVRPKRRSSTSLGGGALLRIMMSPSKRRAVSLRAIFRVSTAGAVSFGGGVSRISANTS